LKHKSFSCLVVGNRAHCIHIDDTNVTIVDRFSRIALKWSRSFLVHFAHNLKTKPPHTQNSKGEAIKIYKRSLWRITKTTTVFIAGSQTRNLRPILSTLVVLKDFGMVEVR
jgi:hypothetical protein